MPALTIDNTASLAAARNTIRGWTPARANACSTRGWSQVGGHATIGFPCSRVNRTGPMDAAPGSTFAFHLSLGEAF